MALLPWPLVVASGAVSLIFGLLAHLLFEPRARRGNPPLPKPDDGSPLGEDEEINIVAGRMMRRRRVLASDAEVPK